MVTELSTGRSTFLEESSIEIALCWQTSARLPGYQVNPVIFHGWEPLLWKSVTSYRVILERWCFELRSTGTAASISEFSLQSSTKSYHGKWSSGSLTQCLACKALLFL